MLDVSLNGLYLRKDLDIIVNKITPDDVLAEKRIDKLTFSRIDGTVYVDNEVHEVYSLDIECTITEAFTYEKIKEIKKILKQRNFEIVLSKKPGIILKGKLLSKVDFTKIVLKEGTFLLSFEVQPFGELIKGMEWATVTSGQKVVNLGNYESKPLIKVTGSGTININYNYKNMKFINVNKTFIIDTELEDVYGEDGENLNRFMDINSDFQAFPEGEFTITYTGASKVEIMPRWREL